VKIERCRSKSCQAEVIFAVSINGKDAILDARPVVGKGNVVLLKTERDDGKPLALVLSNLSERAREAARTHDVALYLDHHATCPDVGSWRK
jgi:hypothetical protein